jgi:hypothetical protein
MLDKSWSALPLALSQRLANPRHRIGARATLATFNPRKHGDLHHLCTFGSISQR